MNSELNSIWLDWRAKVPNGVPNPSNDYHLVLLKELCLSKGIDRQIIDDVILVLEKDEKIPDDTPIKYKMKNKKGEMEDKETTYGSAIQMKKEHPAYIAAKALQSDDKEKESPDKPKGVFDEPPKSGDTERDYMGGAEDGEETRGKPDIKNRREEKKQYLLSKDHKKVEGALRYTKTQAKIDKKSGGRKGVGLGTEASRAGEAAVHTGLRMLKEKPRKTLEQIEKYLTKIVDEDDTYLNAKWVKATTSTLKMIDEKIGIEKIKDVSWDTDEGREAIGVDVNLKTSADMFVRTKDGKNIGISLKQDGSVFLNNGGWAKQSGLLLDNLKDVMPPKEHEALSQAMSIKGYEKDRANKYKEVTRDYTAKDIIKMTNELTPEEIKKSGLGGKDEKGNLKYIKELKDAEKLLEDSAKGIVDGKPALSENQMKAIARLLSIKDKEKEQIIRESDSTLTNKTFAVLNSSDAAKNGMNRHVLKSMHVFDALGLNKDLKKGGVDGFITMYGIPPDGATLDEENILDLFGKDFSNILNEQLQEVRAGKKQPEELEDYMAEKIEINYESGEILFKHENDMKYPLFYLSGRARGIGTAPVMELGQTPFMALALKVGSFDTDKWTPEQKKKLKGELKKEAEERDARQMEED